MKLLLLSRVTEAGKMLEEAAVSNNLELEIVDPGKILVADDDEGKQHFYYIKGANEPAPAEINKPDMIIFRDGTVDMFIKFAMNKVFSDVPTINCYEAIESCRHKYMTQMVLNSAGIKTPKSTLVTKIEQLEAALEFLGEKYPKIIKTVTGSKGVGVIKVDSKSSLKSVLQVVLLSQEEVMIQELLEHSEDYRILTIGEDPVAFVRREIQKDEFRSNLDHSSNASDKPPEIPTTMKEQQENSYKPTDKELKMSVDIAKLLKCEVSAIDYAIVDEECVVFEVNTSPGLEGIQSVNKDINIADLIIKHLIKMSGNKISDVKDDTSPTEDTPPTENSKSVTVTNNVLTTNVIIKRVNNEEEFLAKIDTGAEKSWLGVDDCVLDENNMNVTFMLNDVKYRVNVERLATIRFAGGTHLKEKVPIVKFTIVHDGKIVPDVEFIIGERKSKYKVLLGRKALDQMNLVLNFNPVVDKNVTDDNKESEEEPLVIDQE